MFFLFSVSCWYTNSYLASSYSLQKKKKRETSVLHYVNQTLTCTCVYRGFIRRPMKRHTKCNYTHCAWHLAPLHKWSLQLGLMKEAICKTIQIQMTVNFQLLSSALRFARTHTLLSPPAAHITVLLLGFFLSQSDSDLTWLAVRRQRIIKIRGVRLT